jgi:hypothetical protein
VVFAAAAAVEGRRGLGAHGCESTWFQPLEPIKVKTRFPNFAFKCNLYRYNPGRKESFCAWTLLPKAPKVGGCVSCKSVVEP